MNDKERQELCNALLVYIPEHPRQRKAVLELKRLATENKILRAENKILRQNLEKRRKALRIVGAPEQEQIPPITGRFWTSEE